METILQLRFLLVCVKLTKTSKHIIYLSKLKELFRSSGIVIVLEYTWIKYQLHHLLALEIWLPFNEMKPDYLISKMGMVVIYVFSLHMGYDKKAAEISELLLLEYF